MYCEGFLVMSGSPTSRRTSNRLLRDGRGNESEWTTFSTFLWLFRVVAIKSVVHVMVSVPEPRDGH